MRLLAKGMLPTGYWAFGRQWPRTEAIEVDLTDDEARAVLADPNIVAVVIPETRNGVTRSVQRA